MSRMLASEGIANLTIKHRFASEHPKAYHCIKYLRQNFNFDVIFLDVVDRAIRMLRGDLVFDSDTGDGSALPQPGARPSV